MFNDYPEAGAAFTNFQFIDYRSQNTGISNPSLLENKGVIPNFVQQLAVKQLVQPPAIVVKRSVYENIGSFYAVHFGEDWEMWTRISSKYPVAYSPKYLASYRIAHGIGISYNYMLSGKNVTDIKKVVDIIQNYLPVEKKAFYKRTALSNYALYCLRLASTALSFNKESALIQAKGAWSMSKDLKTFKHLARFYLIYLFRLKDLKRLLKK